MADKNTVITNAIDKLDDLPVQCEIDETDVEEALHDAMREMGIDDISVVVDNSTTEFYLEMRVQYYVLMRIRNSHALDYQYSTGADGKSIDKKDVYKAIDRIMNDLDEKFRKWFSTSFRRTTGNSWSRTYTAGNRLADD